MLTLDQALIQLAEMTAPGKTYTTQQLSALAAQVVLDALPDKPQGSVTLLYSGQINGVSSDKYVAEMVSKNADIRVLDKTQVGRFLANKDFTKAWTDAGGTLSALFDGKTGPWAQASGRFVADTESARGQVFHHHITSKHNGNSCLLPPTTPNLSQPVMRPCVPTTLGASVAVNDTPATYGGAAQGRLAGCQRPVLRTMH
jgi:hypothetical protein